MAFDSPVSDVHALVVDDDVEAAEMAASRLEAEGFRVTTTYDGMSALARAKETQPDLILLDLAMPEVNGYDVVRALRAAKLVKQPFVIAVSSYRQAIVKRRCIEAGFDLHLTKPFDAKLVLRLVALMRENRRLRMATSQLRAQSAKLQSTLFRSLFDAAGHLVDLAATTRDPAAKQRLWEKARRLRELVARNSRAKRQVAFEQSLVRMVLDESLDGALASTGAQMGSIQLVNAEGHLEMVAQRGFHDEYLRYFGSVGGDDALTYGQALRYHTTIAIEDVETDTRYAPHHRAVASSANYRSVCSSPLIVPDGRALGVLSTHFAEPHAFSFPEIEAHGLHAQHTACLVHWATTI